MFRKGDKVKRICDQGGSPAILLNTIYTVSNDVIGEDIVNLDEVVGGLYASRFKLYTTPAEEAVRLLTEAGYTVTPPPPKSSGTITIYRSQGEHRSIVALSSHEIARTGRLSSNYDVIAVVPWTEGDGL